MDRLTYIGHATTLIRLGDAAVLTDPLLGSWLGPLHRQGPAPDPGLPESVGVVVVSHLHRDHLDLRSLRRLRAGTPVVVPRGAGRWASKAAADPVHEIRRGETISVGGVEVTAVPAVHGGHRHRRGEPVEALGYVLAAEGRRIYFAGDTDLFAEMSNLGAVDVALLPVWGWGPSVGPGHLDPGAAAEAVEMIRPRLAIPIHWGTFYPVGLRRLRPGPLTQPPREFARLARELAPEVEVRVVEPGSETSLEDL
jgi:L-ascorbate metabolism protein UlaG (beta-lactamase superfamily)